MRKFIDITKRKSGKVKLEKAGQYTVFLFNYSGELELEVLTKEVSVQVLGLYIGDKQRKYKLNTLQHHVSGKSSSDLLVRGIFFDSSEFEYTGLIKIDPEAQETYAYQKNQNIIMSDSVKVESKPFLEIEADDVYCTHGSTTGKLSDEQIFYLRARGLSTKSAQRILIVGQIEEILDRVVANGHKSEVDLYRQKALKLIK